MALRSEENATLDQQWIQKKNPSTTKRKWLGSLLNFLVPGLGNVYGRKVIKGIVTYALFFFVVLSLRTIAYSFTMFVVSLSMVLGYYVYLFISGYRAVEKGKTYEPKGYDKWYVYILILFAHWTLVSSIKGPVLDRITPINYASIPTPAMDPGLVVGDVLALERTKSISRNDITIFWFPDDPKIMYVKRCIGLPGDSLLIQDALVTINGTPLTGIALKFKFIVITDGSEISPRFLEENQLDENDYQQVSTEIYQFFFTDRQAQEFRKYKFIKSVTLHLETADKVDARVYPNSEEFSWNMDHFGPIYIPRKGDKIQLTAKNIALYRKSIEFENEAVAVEESGIWIDGQLVTTYEFKDNYYFMMGDSRHNSLDSRYWGLLPQELVIGKGMYTYWGRASDRIGKAL